MAQTAADKQLLISKLEPGDVINVRSESALGKAIRWFTKSNVNHSAIYIGNGLLLEAVTIIAIQSVNEYINDSTQEIYCVKANGVTTAQKQQIVNWAITNLATGIFYGVNGIWGLAFRFLIQNYWWRLNFLFKWSGKNPLAPSHNYWCSETVGLIYQQIGFKFTNEDITWLTPGEIWTSPNVTQVS